MHTLTAYSIVHCDPQSVLYTWVCRTILSVGVSAQKVEVFKKGSRADFLHYTASIVMVDHGSTRIPLGGRLFTLIYSNIHTKILAAGKNE